MIFFLFFALGRIDPEG